MSQLNYKTLGQGADVLLLHGLLGMSDNLGGIARALSERYHVIVPDAINHGQSPHRKEVNYDLLAGDVIELMDQLNIQRAAVLGHSMGGKTAMQLALNAPEKVACIIVADIAPVVYPARYHMSVFAAMREVEKAAVTSRQQADQVLADNGISELPMRQFLLKNLKRHESGTWFWQCNLDNLIATYPAICDAPEMKSSYQGPSLFIRGGASEYVQDKHLDAIKTFSQHAQIATIPNASHWLHAEYPQQFAELVTDFLSTHYV